MNYLGHFKKLFLTIFTKPAVAMKSIFKGLNGVIYFIFNKKWDIEIIL